MNDIIVPAERLAELLKHEHELLLLRAGGVDNWVGHGEALYSVNADEQPDLSEYLNFIDELLENGELASEFGFEENGDSEVNVVIDDAEDNYCVGE